MVNEPAPVALLLRDDVIEILSAELSMKGPSMLAAPLNTDDVGVPGDDLKKKKIESINPFVIKCPTLNSLPGQLRAESFLLDLYSDVDKLTIK